MLGRSVFLNIVGTAGSLAVGFVTSILLARWLGPTDRGVLALMTEVYTVALGIVALGLPMTVTYYTSRSDAPRGSILGNTLIYGVGIAALVVPLSWLLHAPIADLFSRGHGGMAWILAGAMVPTLFLDWTTHNQLLGKLMFGRYNVLVIISRLTTLALVILLVGSLDVGVTGAVIAVGAASAVMIGGSLPPLLRDGRPRLDLPYFRLMIRYGRRVQLGTLLQFVNYRLDVLLLQFFRPLRDVGIYVVAVILAELVITLANAFGSSVLPLVSHLEGTARQTALTVSSLRHHTILALVAVAANAIFAPIVILFAYGSGFGDALVPFYILLPGMWFLGTSSVITNDLRGRGRPGTSSLLAAFVVVVTVILDLALIPPFGIAGAAAASLVAYTLFGLVSIVVLARVVGLRPADLVRPGAAEADAYRLLLARLRRRPGPAVQG